MQNFVQSNLHLQFACAKKINLTFISIPSYLTYLCITCHCLLPLPITLFYLISFAPLFYLISPANLPCGCCWFPIAFVLFCVDIFPGVSFIAWIQVFLLIYFVATMTYCSPNVKLEHLRLRTVEVWCCTPDLQFYKLDPVSSQQYALQTNHFAAFLLPVS